MRKKRHKRGGNCKPEQVSVGQLEQYVTVILTLFPSIDILPGFQNTVEAPDLPGDEARNLHGHRARIRQELREEAVNIGLNSVAELSLEDTYDHPHGGARGKKPAPTRGKFSNA